MFEGRAILVGIVVVLDIFAFEVDEAVQQHLTIQHITKIIITIPTTELTAIIIIITTDEDELSSS